MPSLSPILTVMTRAAEKAAKSLLRDFGEVEQLQVSVKGPGDFVSAADRRSEKILHAELSKARPDYSFLMEESGAVGPQDSEYRFIIDPLDGTSNFLHGIPHWSISLALEKRGDLVAAVVYDPVNNEMFYAEKGNGAFMNDRRIRVSGRKALDQAICGMSAHLPSQTDYDSFQNFAKAVHTNFYRYRVMGSMALDLAYVAAGRFDCHAQTTYSWWDAAAGVLIVKEAGGTIHGLEHITDLNVCKNLLASNSELMPAFRKIVGI